MKKYREITNLIQSYIETEEEYKNKAINPCEYIETSATVRILCELQKEFLEMEENDD